MVAGVAALAVVGGSAFLLLRGDDPLSTTTTTPGVTPTDGPRQLEPSWEAGLDGRVLGELAVGDAVALSVDAGDLVLLDTEGDPSWSVAQVEGSVAALDATGEVLVSAGEGPGIAAHALADGAELWRYDDLTYVGVSDSGIVVDVEAEGGPFGALDARTGVPSWSVPDVGAYAVAGETAYVLRGPEVTALSTGDGRVLWTSDVGAGGEATLVANLGLVAVAKGAEVVALDPLDGTERWTRKVRDPGVEVYSDELVLVTGAAGRPGATTAAVYDAEGERGAFPVDSRAPEGLVPFTVDGVAYVLEPVSGTVLDEDLTVLATYDGAVAPAADGVYVLEDGGVSHYPLGASTPDTVVQVPDAGRVVVLEDGFAVVSGDKVTGFR